METITGRVAHLRALWRSRLRLLPFGPALVATTLLFAPAASAAAPSWAITSIASPTHLVPGGETGADYYVLVVTNSGGGATDGSPITITDSLPPGIAVDTHGSHGAAFKAVDDFGTEFPCDPGRPASCTVAETLAPGERILVVVPLVVDPLAPPDVTNRVTVSGGGLPDASIAETDPVSATPAGDGFQDLGISVSDVSGAPETQAGSHPYRLGIEFQLNTDFDPRSAANTPVSSPRDLTTKLPPGLILNPTATVRCTESQLETGACPNASQVGLVQPRPGFGSYPDPTFVSPLYNVVPPPGSTGAFAFDAGNLGIFIHLLGGLDSAGEYSVSARASDLPQFKSVSGMSIEFWGSPSDPGHDHRRGECLESPAFSCPVIATDVPFLTMPSACSSRLRLGIDVSTWQSPATPFSGSAEALDADGNPLGVKGCGALGFEPTLSARLTTNLADSPSGLDVDLHVPQAGSGDTLATSNLRKAVVTLPAGLVVNPAAANGLGACSASQIGLTTPVGQTPAHFSAASSSCPDAAKLGTVEVDSPLLEGPLPGALYLAEPFDNPFGSLLAVYAVVDDPKTGVLVKLAGEVVADPRDGQLTIAFGESPQLPFEELRLKLFGGPGGALRTPATCGSLISKSELTPWSGSEPVLRAGPAGAPAIEWSPGGGRCPASATEIPTAFSLDAGTVSPVAAAETPFVFNLRRDDDSQEISGVDLTGPPGVVGDLTGVGRCPEGDLALAGRRTGAEEQAEPSCPGDSQIGVVRVGAGAGADPYYASGKVYLTGPHGGGPLGLAIVTPALAGPFDLGNVVVRASLAFDLGSGRLRLRTDPIPTVVDGIPLDLRSLDVLIDRRGFVRNPTSCEPSSVDATIATVSGPTVESSHRFQLADCDTLGFKPRLSLSLSGALRRNGHPRIGIDLSPRATDANVSTATVALPAGELLDIRHIRALCPRGLATELCPPASRLGYARLFSPLLEDSLEGPIYLREPTAGFPDLIADLRAGQFSVPLHGLIAPASGGRLQVRFVGLPDLPLSGASITLAGGREGVLVNSEALCGRSLRAGAGFSAHNGKRLYLRPALRLRGRC